MNKDEEIRPCWWHICSGNGGLMWNIESETVASIKSTRLQSNYLLIPIEKDQITIAFKNLWNNHVKISHLSYGTDSEIVSDINCPKYWLKDGDTLTIFNSQIAGRVLEYNFFWLAVDFNWVDPNIGVIVKVIE